MLSKILRLYTPGFIRKKKLKELFYLTADAFQTGLPELEGLSFTESLSEYALFTGAQAERCLQSGCSVEEVKTRLFENSFFFGKNLRKSLHIMNWKESVEALETVYRIIGIDIHFSGRGGSAASKRGVSPEQEEFVIGQCFFSRYYSAETCGLISALDEGLAAGLTGSRLFFTQRITEGCCCCKGNLNRGDF